MKKRDLKIIAQKIINCEREIALGKDVQSNEDKIELYMKNLSPADLMQVIFQIEKISIDNKEKF